MTITASSSGNLSDPTSDLTATYKINPKPLTSDMISLTGTNFENKVVIIDRGGHRIGSTVKVRVTDASSATLKGVSVEE